MRTRQLDATALHLHLPPWLKVKRAKRGSCASANWRSGLRSATPKIRFYEARGLLPPATRLTNRYRDYDERALLTVRFIDRAQSLGFTLAEIARHLHLPQGVDRKASLQGRLEAKLVEIDAHILAAQERRSMIVSLIEEVRGLRG